MWFFLEISAIMRTEKSQLCENSVYSSFSCFLCVCIIQFSCLHLQFSTWSGAWAAHMRILFLVKANGSDERMLVFVVHRNYILFSFDCQLAYHGSAHRRGSTEFAISIQHEAIIGKQTKTSVFIFILCVKYIHKRRAPDKIILRWTTKKLCRMFAGLLGRNPFRQFWINIDKDIYVRCEFFDFVYSCRSWRRYSVECRQTSVQNISIQTKRVPKHANTCEICMKIAFRRNINSITHSDVVRFNYSWK